MFMYAAGGEHPLREPCPEILGPASRRYPRHSARDLIPVAMCLRNGIRAILIADTDFERVAGMERIRAEDCAAVARVLRT